MLKINKTKTDKIHPYPTFIIPNKSFEAKFAKIAVSFKNYWFDNCFGINHKIKNGYRPKRGIWYKFLRSNIGFKIGQFIIHKLFWPYSFSTFKHPEKNKLK